jgi:hypothetical protein
MKPAFENERDLDRLLAEARQQTPDVPDALMARILADADAAMPPLLRSADRHPRQVGPTAVMPGQPAGLFGSLWSALGGWAGAGSLAAVAAVGVWIGFAPPTTGLATVTNAIFGTSVTVHVLSDDTIYGLEG